MKIKLIKKNKYSKKTFKIAVTNKGRLNTLGTLQYLNNNNRELKLNIFKTTAFISKNNIKISKICKHFLFKMLSL
jgi:hypothetical protein